jgi:endoglucanase
VNADLDAGASGNRCDAGCSSGDGSADAGATPRAPGGYVVAGNRVVDVNGASVRWRGANLPSLIWDVTGSVITEGDATRMASWGANVVRIGLNQGFWLEGATGCDARCYRENVLRVVGWARDAGLDVILDLHWATAGGLVPPQFMEMPDTHSLQFWSEVAAAFASDGRVHFDLYNEPHDVDWTIWRQGGMVNGLYDPDTTDADYSRGASIQYQAVGMQALYDAVRAAGAQNLVIAGGLDWAFDLSGLASARLAGHNIVYATHLYPFATKMPEHWDGAFGFLRQDVPLLIAEFAPGSTDNPECPERYATDVLTYADASNLHWVAWAWFASGASDDPLGRCNSSFFFQEPNAGSPLYALTPFGALIQAALGR